MNYLAIFILVIVVIFLLQKKQVTKYKEENVSKENLTKMHYIKENTEYIYTKDKTDIQIVDEINTSNKEYVFLTKEDKITQNQIDIVIYNFILEEENVCGFNMLYYVQNTKGIIKNIATHILVACINYIQMLRKEDIYSYHFVCLKKDNILKGKTKNINKKKVNVQCFELSEFLKKEVTTFRVKEFVLKRNKLRISSILNFAFAILAGTVVTANVIYNLNEVINKNASVYNVLACALIYVCYSNILSKVYSPMGRFRFVASYLFPIYIVLYVVLTAYYYIKVVGEVLVKKKKNFLISLIILLIVYVIFILLK